MNKFIIGVDMDDTIENLLPAWLQRLNIKYHKSYTVEDIKCWDMTKCLDIAPKDIFDVLFEKDFWDTVKPKEDAIKYLKLLNEDERVSIFIVTNSHYEIFQTKIEKVLLKYFPFLSHNQVICIKNKELLNCHLLVDDYPENLIKGSYDKILIDMPYNKDCQSIDINDNSTNLASKFSPITIKRTTYWGDIYNYICDKLNSLEEL